MTETREGATDAVLPTLQEVPRVVLDLGEPVTPPRPTAPTAAELRANFAHDYCPVHTTCHNGTRGPCDWLAELDALVAAVRAEALEDAAREVECRGHVRKLLAETGAGKP